MSLTPEELDKKIQEARDRQSAVDQKPAVKSTHTGGGDALRAATDLVAALVVGGFLGYWIDQWLGTRPFGMIIFFFLGFGAGFMNIYRSQTGQDYKIGFKDKDRNKD